MHFLASVSRAVLCADCLEASELNLYPVREILKGNEDPLLLFFKSGTLDRTNVLLEPFQYLCVCK